MKRFASVVLAIIFSLTLIGYALAEDPTPVSENWSVHYYVDQFGDPTDEWYIACKPFAGHFSNSATTNSDLAGFITIDKDKIAIHLYEYGKFEVNNVSSSIESYKISVKDSAGQVYSFTGNIYSKGDRIVVSSWDREKLLNIFNNGGKVTFAITKSDNSLNKYVFSIDDTSGFSDVYSQLTSTQA